MKTSCDQIQTLLDSYFINELSSLQSQQVREHLSQCEQCRSLADSHEQLANQFQGLPLVQCPEHVVQAIESATWGKEQTLNPWQRFCSLFTLSNKSGGFFSSLNSKPLTTGFAAVSLTACLLAYVHFNNVGPTGHTDYSEAEIHLAKKQLQWSLAHVIQTIDQTESAAVNELVQNEIPRLIKNRIKDTTSSVSGGSL